ncbi:MAG TPA: branched-chain amino acid ABC transporter ATP-binding protein/permease [Solirubrobacterales bacterium]|nr:branched-chain amino acid ABC transporter ATP-binding protein/permease [Solirubrobacterales bacterium]
MSRVRFRTPQSAAASLLVPLLAIAITALLGANGTPSFQDTVTTILCNLIIVIGLQVFVGNSGVYSFGQLGFATAGAYIAAFLTLPAAIALLQTPGLPHFIADAHLGALPSTLIAAAISGLLAIVVGLPLMRTSTLAIPISTFAFLLVVYNVVANWDRVTGGSSGLVSIPSTTSVESAALWAGATVVLALAYKWSASGYRLQATREDEVAARSIGIGLMRERLIAFGISGVLCGIGGALAVHQSGVLSPVTFYFGATVTTMTMLVVGGARSVFGAVIGAIAIATVNELLRGVENGASLFGAISIGEAPGLAAIGLGLILLATMIAMPNGLSRGREAGELPWLQRLGLSSPAPAPGPPLDDAVAGKHARERPENGALRAEGISLAFAGLRVLKEVDLTLEPGEALGLIGPNGAGKTTLVNVLSGFQTPDSGTVSLEGADVTGHSPARLAHEGLGRTFQAALPFPDLSGLESVAVGAMGMGLSKRRAVAVAADVLGRLDLLEQATLPAGALPPGSQRLLGIARALAIGPRYLLLDEPAAGLNEAECEELVAILRNVLSDFGCGILLIEHDMSIVMPLCSRVQVLDDGTTIRVGTPQEVQDDPAVVESYLGSSFLAAIDA